MRHPSAAEAGRSVAAGVALLLAVLTGASGPAAAPAGPAAPLPAVAAKRPHDLGPSPAPAELDCAAAPTLVLTVGTVDTLTGDTSGFPSLTAGYSCAAWNESGPEAVFRLDIAAALRLRAELVSGADLDLFLLTACDGASCLAAANTLLAADLPAGEAFLVVDGYLGAAGAFELHISCVESGLPLEVCDPFTGVARRVACQGSFEGTLLGMPNRAETSAACGTLEAATGGESWFAVAVPARHSVTATVAGTWFDAVLWIWGSCGPAAACLGWADDELAGGREELIYENRTPEDRVVWVAVDSFRPLNPSDPDPGHAQFALQLSCQTNVPVEGSSLGGLKGRYR